MSLTALLPPSGVRKIPALTSLLMWCLPVVRPLSQAALAPPCAGTVSILYGISIKLSILKSLKMNVGATPHRVAGGRRPVGERPFILRWWYGVVTAPFSPEGADPRPGA